MKRIESVQNATVKELVRLHRKKERDRQKRFLVEGGHMVQEAARAGLLQQLFIREDVMIPQDVQAEVILCTQPVLNKLSVQESDALMIGVVKAPDSVLPSKTDRVLLLDEVQDPGNLGTLIRSAVSFGFQAVVCSDGCADCFGPKALQASQGAVFYLPVIREPLGPVIEDLKTRMPVFAAALHRDSIPLQQLPAQTACGLVLGNEGQGIREPILDQCTETVYIEMDAFESLNVAVAGSILMYCLRQRQ